MARLTRWNPYWDAFPLLRLAERMAVAPGGVASDVYMPPMDIEEQEDQYVVTLSVPGYTKEQLNISVDDNVLHIQGALSQEHEGGNDREGHKYHLRERRMDQFSRSLRLSKNVVIDRISASYDAGVLTLNIPKSEEVLPRKISIGVS